MILAAGLGTRLRPLTNTRPKALAPVRGVRVLDYWVMRLAEEGFEAVVVNAHHLGSEIVRAVREGSWPVPVEVAVEDRLLGTGGGIRNVLDFFGGDSFAVVNADIVCNAPLRRLADIHRASNRAVSMLLHDFPRFNNVAVDGGGRILGFGRDLETLKSRDLSFEKLAFTGIHFIHPRVLESRPAGEPLEILTVYRDLIAGGNPPGAWMQPGLFWREMGSIESYRSLCDELANSPAGSMDPFPCGSHAVVHPDARIEECAELKGHIAVGAGCVVERGAVLEDTILWDRVTVRGSSRLVGCIVADGVEVSGEHRGEVIASDGYGHVE